MMKIIRAALSLICAAAVGCGPSLVKPQLRIVADGQPLDEAKLVRAEVEVFPLYGGKTAVVSQTKPVGNGLFVVDGPDGRGVPPGPYVITLHKVGEYGPFTRAESQLKFEAGPESGIVYTVDLAKKTVER